MSIPQKFELDGKWIVEKLESGIFEFTKIDTGLVGHMSEEYVLSRPITKIIAE